MRISRFVLGFLNFGLISPKIKFSGYQWCRRLFDLDQSFLDAYFIGPVMRMFLDVARLAGRVTRFFRILHFYCLIGTCNFKIIFKNIHKI